MRVTIENIINEFVGQKFVARTLLYSNTDYGRVWLEVSNVQGSPWVSFMAAYYDRETNTFSTEHRCYQLDHALTYIGVPEN